MQKAFQQKKISLTDTDLFFDSYRCDWNKIFTHMVEELPGPWNGTLSDAWQTSSWSLEEILMNFEVNFPMTV